MEPRLQRRVQRYGWDKAAAYYEAFWKRQLEPAQARLLELANLRPGERVLDVACGTGLVSFRAAAAVGPEGAVVGTDISEQMVSSAREESARANISHATFERMDAEASQLSDGSFHVALCSLGLMYVPDPPAALKEMYRVLSPAVELSSPCGGRETAVAGPISSRSSMRV